MQGNWKQEHGEEYAVPDAIASHPLLKDISWHNDAMPCFAVRFAGACVMIWIEHPTRHLRESDSDQRVCVARYEVERNHPDQMLDWVANEYEGDDIAKAITTALTVGLEQAQAHPILSRALTPALLENVRKAMA